MQFSSIKTILSKTIDDIVDLKILKLSAALSYFTVFAIGPMLMLLLYLSAFFYGREALEGSVFYQIKSFVGVDGAKQIQDIIKNLSLSNEGPFAATIGIIALIFAATSVFAEIQDSINSIWRIQIKKTSGIWIFVKTRLLSFGVIGSFGFVLLVTLVVSSLMDALSERLLSKFTNIAVVLVYGFNVILTFVVTTCLFGAIFAILPDAKIKWKQVRIAAIFTAIMFMLGKFLISFYISFSEIGDAYGAASSIVILMVWVYYSSFLLYTGASLAKNYAIVRNYPIQPSKHAEFITLTTIIHDNASLNDSFIIDHNDENLDNI